MGKKGCRLASLLAEILLLWSFKDAFNFEKAKNIQ